MLVFALSRILRDKALFNDETVEPEVEEDNNKKAFYFFAKSTGNETQIFNFPATGLTSRGRSLIVHCSMTLNGDVFERVQVEFVSCD